jgi:hypothetical protein
MRSESTADHLGGRAMLNALSTAMFAVIVTGLNGFNGLTQTNDGVTAAFARS